MNSRSHKPYAFVDDGFPEASEYDSNYHELPTQKSLTDTASHSPWEHLVHWIGMAAMALGFRPSERR